MSKKILTLRPVTQKVLLVLATGIVLGLSGSPRRYFKILRDFKKDWETIDRRALHRAIKNLYQSKLVDTKDNSDGSVTMYINNKGKRTALTYQIDEMKIPAMKKWDEKWRVVLFDIPEKYGAARRALRNILKNMEFYQFQKSVFIHPFECTNEVDFVRHFFSVESYVCIMVAESLDGESRLRKHYNL